MADSSEHYSSSEQYSSEPDNGPQSSPSETMPTVSKAWISQDLDILRSGLYADAEIICEGKVSRKVHRSILASRSEWFQKAFSDAYTHGNIKVNLKEDAWRVDLILYFFYVGHIDMADETLTGGRGLLEISIELIRLGKALWERKMREYGENLLISHLGKVLDDICDICATLEEKEAGFDKQADFPNQFQQAVRNAFNTERPVKLAQFVLADFAFAARLHLFQNPDFVSFI